MKKLLFIVVILAIFLTGADKEPDLISFTVINKSGYDISIWLLDGKAYEPPRSPADLKGPEDEEEEDEEAITYYLTVEKGDRKSVV